MERFELLRRPFPCRQGSRTLLEPRSRSGLPLLPLLLLLVLLMGCLALGEACLAAAFAKMSILVVCI